MIKVTLDTNVLVSGTFWAGDSYKVLIFINERKIKCYLSKEIIKEYIKILNSEEIIDKIENKNLIVSNVIQKVLSISTIVDPKNPINIVDDPDDNKFIEAAIEGNVDYIISQDKHLLKIKEYKGIKILTPADFLKLV